MSIVVVEAFVACVLNLIIVYYACSLLPFERLFCLTHQTCLNLQDGGLYLVTIDREFGDVIAPYLQTKRSAF